MSEKKRFILAHQVARSGAIEAVRSAPDGYVVDVAPAKRSLDQNAKLWPMLTDISRQVLWPVDGELQHLIEEDWKDIFTAALRKHQRMAKGIDGGIVMLGSRTSKMKKPEFCDLLEIIYAFGSERGVQWSEPKPVTEREKPKLRIAA